MALPPFFGRAWRLAIETSDGETYSVRSLVAAGEQPLRLKFQVEMTLTLAYWQAQIDIYNLSSSTSTKLLRDAPDMAAALKFNQRLVLGDRVTLSAGYQTDASGSFDADANLIYAGQVFQPIWMRENVVDYNLRLRCITALAENALSQVSFAVGSGATDYDTIGQVCQKSGLALDADPQSQQAMSQRPYGRSQVIQGKTTEVLRGISRANNLFSWVDQSGFHVRSFDAKTIAQQPPQFAYGTPQSDFSNAPASTIVRPTLIESPQQTQDGVVFRALMDPTVKIGNVVQVSKSVLLMPYQPQYGRDLPVVTNQDGTYVVAGIRHVGDTRGESASWYTEITGMMVNFFPDFLRTRQPWASQ